MSRPAQNVPLGCGLALMGFALFSVHDVLIKALGENYSVFQTLFFAGLFSYIPMTGVIASNRRVENFLPKSPWLVGLRALMTLFSMSTAFYAFSVLPLAQVYALIFATPLLVTLLAVPLLSERIRLRRGLASMVGLLGVVIVLRPGVVTMELGHIAGLAAAVSNACSVILVRKLGGTERTVVLVLYPMFAMTIGMAILLPSVYRPVELFDLTRMALVGWIALTAQSLIVNSYRFAPATVISPMQYSQMIWAVIFGLWLFGERPDFWTLAGSAVIVASGIYIVLREGMVSAKSPVSKTFNPRPDAGPIPKRAVYVDEERVRG